VLSVTAAPKANPNYLVSAQPLLPTHTTWYPHNPHLLLMTCTYTVKKNCAVLNYAVLNCYVCDCSPESKPELPG